MFKTLILTGNNHIHIGVKDNVDIICEFNDDNLSNGIKTLLNDEKLCKQFGKTRRHLIETKYDWDKVSKQIEGIYQNCII